MAIQSFSNTTQRPQESKLGKLLNEHYQSQKTRPDLRLKGVVRAVLFAQSIGKKVKDKAFEGAVWAGEKAKESAIDGATYMAGAAKQKQVDAVEFVKAKVKMLTEESKSALFYSMDYVNPFKQINIRNSGLQAVASGAAAYLLTHNMQATLTSSLLGGVTGNKIEWKKTAKAIACFALGHLLYTAASIHYNTFYPNENGLLLAPKVGGHVLGALASFYLQTPATLNVVGSVYMSAISQINGLITTSLSFLQGLHFFTHYANDADHLHYQENPLPNKIDDLPDRLAPYAEVKKMNKKEKDGSITTIRKLTLNKPDDHPDLLKVLNGALFTFNSFFLVGKPLASCLIFLLSAAPEILAERMRYSEKALEKHAGYFYLGSVGTISASIISKYFFDNYIPKF